LTADERAEWGVTEYIKPANPSRAVAPHLKTLLARPLPYLKAAAYTLGLCLSAPKRSATYLLYFVEAVILGSWMTQRNLGHVHSHFSSSVCLIACRIFPVTMSITIHGPAEFTDPFGFQLAEKIKASSFICAISNFARSQLMTHSGHDEWHKFEVSPLGVDPSVYAPRPFRERPAPFEIICVGRLTSVKAQHILIEAVGALVQAGRDVRLRIVGDGPDRASLEHSVAGRALEGRVIFTGWLNQDRVLALYEESDVFALASFAEGVPVVLMEAMAMEIPCVATCINGIPELIRDGVDGLLVSPSDPEPLAEAIARLMDDAPLRRRLGEAGRRRVCDRYDLQRNAARLASIFERRLGPGGQAVEGAGAPVKSEIKLIATNNEVR